MSKNSVSVGDLLRQMQEVESQNNGRNPDALLPSIRRAVNMCWQRLALRSKLEEFFHSLVILTSKPPRH